MILHYKNHRMIHPIYSMQHIEDIKVTHKEPEKFRDHLANRIVKILRKSFDIATGFNSEKMTEH